MTESHAKGKLISELCYMYSSAIANFRAQIEIKTQLWIICGTKDGEICIAKTGFRKNPIDAKKKKMKKKMQRLMNFPIFNFLVAKTYAVESISYS